jgi:nucleotide-binding universal stress UspA family protein
LYKKIFIPLDNSKYSDYCSDLGITIAKKYSSELIGGHVYAANLHHKRFREMESGLPEKYKDENELKKQRAFHNSLIGRGLRMISNSYLDGLDKKCQNEEVPFTRNIQEGKNYLELVKDISNKDYDLVIIGIRGLGETNSSQIGSVCERVVRRINTDVLVVKNDKSLDGKVIVAVDGSEQSFRSVEIAGKLTKEFGSELEALSVYDPHYHRVAFDGIAKILTGEMGNVFKSEEQEKLHEDVIDKGLEKIYRGHLKVALNRTKDFGIEIKTTLLEGKPYDQILKYVEKVKPSLLILGRTGIHAINGLDIGSATENILRFANCNVLITKNRKDAGINPFYPVRKKATHCGRSKEYIEHELSNGVYEKKENIGTEQPLDQAVEAGEISWDKDASRLISKVPAFVRKMVVEEIENYARNKGSSEITREIVEEVKAKWSNAMNYS